MIDFDFFSKKENNIIDVTNPKIIIRRLIHRLILHPFNPHRRFIRLRQVRFLIHFSFIHLFINQSFLLLTLIIERKSHRQLVLISYPSLSWSLELLMGQSIVSCLWFTQFIINLSFHSWLKPRFRICKSSVLQLSCCFILQYQPWFSFGIIKFFTPKALMLGTMKYTSKS